MMARTASGLIHVAPRGHCCPVWEGSPMPTRLAQVRAERGWKKARLVRELGIAAARRSEVLPKDDSLGRRIAVWENQGGTVSDFYRDLLCEVYGLSAVELGLVQPSTVGPPPMPLLELDERLDFARLDAGLVDLLSPDLS